MAVKPACLCQGSDQGVCRTVKTAKAFKGAGGSTRSTTTCDLDYGRADGSVRRGRRGFPD